jgi:alpha-L-fucosidase
LTLSFPKPVAFNRFLVQEYIPLGQRVKSFTVDALVNGQWKKITEGTTIGYKRILRFNKVKATKIRLTINDAKSSPLIANLGVYDAPQILAAPEVMRNKSGEIKITPADAESEIYYTLDGTDPTLNSSKYSGPIKTSDSKLLLKAMAHDAASGKNSSVTTEQFDISRNNWKVIGIEDKNANNMLDGDPNTEWYQSKSNKMPVDLVIDLGKVENVSGFKYLPDQHWWGSGIITQYSFFVSIDGENWKQVNAGEFSNIKNNPVWQVKPFAVEKVRFIKLRALRNTQNNDAVGYAEVDVITD